MSVKFLFNPAFSRPIRPWWLSTYTVRGDCSDIAYSVVRHSFSGAKCKKRIHTYWSRWISLVFFTVGGSNLNVVLLRVAPTLVGKMSWKKWSTSHLFMLVETTCRNSLYYGQYVFALQRFISFTCVQVLRQLIMFQPYNPSSRRYLSVGERYQQIFKTCSWRDRSVSLLSLSLACSEFREDSKEPWGTYIIGQATVTPQGCPLNLVLRVCFSLGCPAWKKSSNTGRLIQVI